MNQKLTSIFFQNAFRVLQLEEDELDVYKILTFIIKIGEIQFGEDQREQSYVKEESKEIIDSITKLLDIPYNEWHIDIIYFLTDDRSDSYRIPLNHKQVIEFTRHVGDELYKKLWLYLLEKINEVIFVPEFLIGEIASTIDIIDPPGFISHSVR